MEDMFDIAKETRDDPSNEKRTMLIIHKMLGKAYPDLTLEDVKAMPLKVIPRLMQILNAESDFLPVQRTLPLGLTSTRRRSKSGS
jgi:hypothetical protein